VVAFLLFVLALGGSFVVADLLRENTTLAGVTVFHQPVGAYPQGWLLALAAGLGFAVAMLLVGSVSAANRRARRRQARPARRGLPSRAPAHDQDRLLDEFFGPDEAPRQPSRQATPTHPRSDRRPAPRDPFWDAPGRVTHHPEPTYEQARRAVRPHDDIDRRSPAGNGRRW
jgi:hypothetical protein